MDQTQLIELLPINYPPAKLEEWIRLAGDDDVAKQILGNPLIKGSPAGILRAVASAWTYHVPTHGTPAQRLEEAKVGTKAPLTIALEAWMREAVQDPEVLQDIRRMLLVWESMVVEGLEELMAAISEDLSQGLLRQQLRLIIEDRDSMECVAALLRTVGVTPPTFEIADEAGKQYMPCFDFLGVDGVPDLSQGRWLRSKIEWDDSWWLWNA